MERVERLLQLLVLNAMKGLTMGEKATQFSATGMNHQDIATLLGTTPDTINQLLYRSRRKTTTKKSTRKTTKKVSRSLPK